MTEASKEPFPRCCQTFIRERTPVKASWVTTTWMFVVTTAFSAAVVASVTRLLRNKYIYAHD